MQSTQERMERDNMESSLEKALESLAAGGESATAEAELARRDAELLEREQRLQRELEEFERRREMIEAQRQEINLRLERQTAELREQWSELENQQEAFKAQCEVQGASSSRGEARQIEEHNSVAPKPDQSGAPELVDRRRQGSTALQSSPLIAASSSPTRDERDAEDRQTEAQAEAVEVEEPELAQPEAPPERTQRAADEEQSIEQYMAALLNRMRGGTTESVIAPQAKRAKHEESKPARDKVEQPSSPAKVEPAVAESRCVMDSPRPPVQLGRRIGLPTEANDMAKLREVANTQTRIAFDIHAQGKMFKAALANWVTGLGAVLVTILLLGFVPSNMSVLRTGCMAGFVASAYWFFMGLKSTQEWIAAGLASRNARNVLISKKKSDEKPSSPSAG
jgi:hypothetical protein